MFGSVPKNLWAKRIKPDEDNRILLATRSLLITDKQRKILVDVGLGNKWSEKARKIYAIQSFSEEEAGIDPGTITDIIITHLHFDHAGGLTRHRPGSEELELVYPHARIYIQETNWNNAHKPSLKERASYLNENYEILTKTELHLVNGSVELYPDVWVHQINGHTRGQQWVEIRDSRCSILYPSDLVPTSHHLPISYHMGYDVCAETLMREKEEFLSTALARNSVIVFKHDPSIEAATLTKDDKGHFTVRSHIEI